MDDELERLNNELKRKHNEINNAGIIDFEGYSPSEITTILYNPMDPNCVVQFSKLDDTDLNEIPLLMQVKFLCEIVRREGKLKLTSKDYLSVKVVKELYSTGLMKDHMIESGISKLYRENECLPVHLTHIVATVTALFKKTKGTITISNKGEKLLKDDNILLLAILETCLTKYNWAYFDRYESESIGRLGALFSFILLSKYGSETRNVKFYSNKYKKAFPILMQEIESSRFLSDESIFNSCYEYRTFHRFMNFLGILEYVNGNFNAASTIKTNDLFHKLVKLKPHQSLSNSN